MAEPEDLRRGQKIGSFKLLVSFNCWLGCKILPGILSLVGITHAILQEMQWYAHATYIDA